MFKFVFPVANKVISLQLNRKLTVLYLRTRLVACTKVNIKVSLVIKRAHYVWQAHLLVSE